jgi:SAM-dependent methyltransferase
MPLSVQRALTENYRDYYDQEDGLTEWRRLGAIDKCTNILRLCSEVEHTTVLEVGCGNGAILERLLELNFGARYTGLEISSSAVRRVREKNLPDVEVGLFDGYQIPEQSKCFDLAILSHVLEHVEYPRQLIYEAARVAKTVFVEVPLENNWRLSRDFVSDRVGHIDFYCVKTIRRLVQSSGLQILQAHLSHNSLPVYVYRKGRLRGYLSCLVKELALKFFPTIATSALTYNYSLIYTSASLNQNPLAAL